MAKTAVRLTDREIKNAQPSVKNYKLYDGEGLQLLVRTSGTKVWQYPYKFKDKNSIYTIGKYDSKNASAITLKEARIMRNEVRALLDQGIDPNTHKKASMSGAGDINTTFEALGREWHSKNPWCIKHSKNVLRALEAYVFTIIGNKQITDVSRQDIITVLAGVEERGALDVAKRTCQRCEAIFDYAIAKGVCDDNPALGRSKYIQKVKSKARPHLKENQMSEFLNELKNYHGRDFVKIAMQLQVILLLRPGELRQLRWEYVDFNRALIEIPAHIMKKDREHIVPLSNQALDYLKQLKLITGRCELLFPSVKNNGKPITEATLRKVLVTLGYAAGSGKHAVPHGFRHTASTILNEHGHNRDYIEKQLAHSTAGTVRGVYNRAEYLEGRKVMMQWYSDHLDGLRKK